MYICFYHGGCQEMQQRIVKRLQALGYSAHDSGHGIYYSICEPNNEYSDKTIYYTGSVLPSYNHKEGSLTDLFHTEKYKIKPKFHQVKLSEEYTADVYKDKVVVNCHTISKEKVKDILDKMNSL